MSGPRPDLEAARRAKAELAERLAGDERVVGIGIAVDYGQHADSSSDNEGTGDAPGGYQVKVNLAKPEPDLELPAEIGGVPVRTEVVGEVRPL